MLLGSSTFTNSLVMYYARLNQCPYHTALDVDIEDLVDFYFYIKVEEHEKKERKFDEVFNSL